MKTNKDEVRHESEADRVPGVDHSEPDVFEHDTYREDEDAEVDS